MTVRKSDDTSNLPVATASTDVVPNDTLIASYPAVEDAVRRDVRAAGVTELVPAFLEAEVTHSSARVRAGAQLMPEKIAKVRQRDAKREHRYRRRVREVLRLEERAARAEQHEAGRKLAKVKPPRRRPSRTAHGIVFTVVLVAGAWVVSLLTAPAFAAQELGADAADLLGVREVSIYVAGAFVLACITCGAKGVLALLFSRRSSVASAFLFVVHVLIAFATAVFRGGGTFGLITFAIAAIEIGVGVIFLWWGHLLADEFAEKREEDAAYGADLHELAVLGELSVTMANDVVAAEAAVDRARVALAHLDEVGAREARQLELATTTAAKTYVTETLKMRGEVMSETPSAQALKEGENR